MYIIRGFKKNTGFIEGRNWENYSLFCTLPNDDGVTGESVATIKVKTDILKRCIPNPNDAIGLAVEFSFKQTFFNGKPSIAVTDIKIVKKGA